MVPLPNPAFDPSQYRLEDEGQPKPRPAARAKPAADDAADPRLKGWKARGCAADVKDGIVTLNGSDGTPFLGVGAGVSGPATVAFRIRGDAGGSGKVEWLQPGTAPKAEHTVPYTIKAGAWQTVTLRLPADGPLGIFRLYLPAARQPVDIDWIGLTPDAGASRRWDF